MKQKYFSLLLVLFCISNTPFAQNNAIDLAGTANYVTIPTTYSLNINTFTVEFDFYMNVLQDFNGGISSTNSNIPQPLDFYVDNTGQATVVLGNGSQFEITTLTTLSAGQWYHIAIIVDNGTLRAYINGNLAALSLISVPISSTGNIRIGDRMDNATNANARFDNVRIWSVARTATEIQNNITSCLVGNEPGLDIYYTFENISGNTVTDLAGNNDSQDGTIVGTFTNATGTNCTPTVPPAPTTNYATQIFTGDDKTLANLQVTGNNIKWYSLATGGFELPNSTLIYDEITYYASQTVTGVESINRLAITVNKISNNTQMVPPSSTVADLVASTSTGATAQWFSSASSGSPLANTEALVDGVYYVEQVNSTIIETLGTGFDTPSGVAIDVYGRIVVADYGNNAIKRMNANGNNIEVLGSGFNHPYGVAIQADGSIVIADTGNNAVKRMDINGTNIVTLGSGFYSPTSVAIQADGKIIVADSNNNAIKRMNADGTNIVTLNSGFFLPLSAVIQADGKIIIADSGNNAIKRMDENGTNIVTLAGGLNFPSGVLVQSDGKILFTDTDINAIKRMDADGSNISTIANGFSGPVVIAMQSDGKIVVADSGSSTIKRITEAATSNRVAVQVSTTTTSASHLNFDGNNDYIQLTHFEKPNEFTIEAWVKTNYEYNNTIISWSKNSNDTSHTKLRTDDGDVDFYIYDYVNDISNTISSSITINSNWHHIAVVKNANPTNNLEIYVDGVLGATGTVNINITSDNLLIGARSYNNLEPSEFFEGDLDEIRIWNVAKTVTEINASKDCELLGNESGLLAYYTFNQGYDQANNPATTSLTNSVSGGSNGVLNNFNLYGTTSNWLSGSPVASGVTCASLSNSSFTSSEDFLLYPNPTSGIFNIGTEKESTITIYDVLGKEIILKNNNLKTIDISHYPNGIYFVKITTLSGESTLNKLVKK